MTGKRKIGIILGTGLHGLFKDNTGLKASVDTGFGTSEAYELSTNAYLMLRHGIGHSIPPHLINYRANVKGLHQLGVEYVIATASVGAINQRFPVGTFAVPDQFIDMTKDRISTFFNEPQEKFEHVDMTHPYSEKVRHALISSLKKSKIPRFKTKATYVCTEGPRFETPAEILMYRKMGGDVVGMTGVPEVVLAKEIGLEYATLSFVTNLAAGMQTKITQSEVSEKMQKSLTKTKAILEQAISELSR
jgi:5'-methylthioadenosine phosphorylase